MDMDISKKQMNIAFAVMYVLGIAGVLTWPFQSWAHNLFFFFTVLMASVPALMLIGVGRVIDESVQNTKERKEGYTADRKKTPRNISLAYLPMILILVGAGYWLSACLWIFMYTVLMLLSAEVTKRLKKEEAYDNIASVSDNIEGAD